MKNIFVKTALAAAVLCAPTAYAEGDYTVLKIGGGVAAVAGTAFYIVQKGEADDCKKINAQGGKVITCTNQSDLDDAASLGAGVAIIGVGALIAGFVLENQAVPFQILAKPDGSIALERDGLSLATRGDKFSLQKRWTF